MLTKAYANHAADKPFAPYQLQRRDIGLSDVGIEIQYCGICHSDIHTARSEWGPAFYPCVPGHEIVGKVVAVGANVSRFTVDDIVGVGCMVDSCKQCSSCQDDLEQFCESGFTGTYNSNAADGSYTKGGYSRYIVVRDAFVLRIPTNLPPAAVAPLLCAGITTYSPLKHVGVTTGTNVAVMGLGGLGHMAVKLAKAFGATVSVLSHSPHKQQEAKRLGADHFLLTNDTKMLAKHTQQFDVILNTVSSKHNLAMPLNLLRRDGTLILVGVAEQPLELPAISVIFPRRKIMGSLIGGIAETQEMLDFCGKHNIVSDIEIIPAAKINEAYERVLTSDVKYRFVIDCATI